MTNISKVKKVAAFYFSAFVVTSIISAFALSFAFESRLFFALSAQAGEAPDAPSYTSFEELRQEIGNPAGRELNIVSGTVLFPTPIHINRDIHIESLGAPAEFSFAYDETYPQNDNLLSNEAYYPQLRHFVIWAEEEVQSVRNDNEYLIVGFKNIIFRAEGGFGGIYAPNGNVKLFFEDCIFEELGGDNVFGGAVTLVTYTSDFYGSIKHTFYQSEFKNCTFINNTGIFGGGIFASTSNVEEVYSKIKLALQNCSFSKNTALVGKNIYIDNPATWVTYTDCIDVDFDVDDDVILQLKNGALPIPVKTGYVFLHWENETGEPLQFPTNEILEMGQAHPSAVWIPKTFTISYHGVDAPTEFPKIHTFGQATVLFPPQKDGYIFLGWLLPNADEPTKYLTLGAQDFLENITLTAVWEPIPPPAPFPAWGIALIIMSGITVLVSGMFCVLFILRRRNFAPETASLSDAPDTFASSAESDVKAENIEALARRYSLTAREREIVALLIKGNSQSAIAKELFISAATVKKHTQNIYGKLDIKSRFELIALTTHRT